MSWKRTTHECKTCYERNGQRLFRTQDIDALEEAERRDSERENEKMRFYNPPEEERIYDNEDNEDSKYDGLIVLFMLIFFILMYIFN